MTSLMKKKEKESQSLSITDPIHDPQGLHQKISVHAYELFLKRGQVHGHDLDDWLQAEGEILAELKSKGKTQKTRSAFSQRRRSKQTV